MARPTTYKTFYLTSVDEQRKMKSSQAHYFTERYDTEWFIGGCETNIPWSELRAWFSHAGVKMPSQMLIDTGPLRDAYTEEELHSD